MTQKEIFAFVVTESGAKWSDEGIDWLLQTLPSSLEPDEHLNIVNGTMANDPRQLAHCIDRYRDSIIVFSDEYTVFGHLKTASDDEIDSMVNDLNDHSEDDNSWSVLERYFKEI